MAEMPTWQKDGVRWFVQAGPEGTGFPDNARGLGLGLIPETTILNHAYHLLKQPRAISMQGQAL